MAQHQYCQSFNPLLSHTEKPHPPPHSDRLLSFNLSTAFPSIVHTVIYLHSTPNRIRQQLLKFRQLFQRCHTRSSRHCSTMEQPASFPPVPLPSPSPSRHCGPDSARYLRRHCRWRSTHSRSQLVVCRCQLWPLVFHGRRCNSRPRRAVSLPQRYLYRLSGRPSFCGLCECLCGCSMCRRGWLLSTVVQISAIEHNKSMISKWELTKNAFYF